MATQLPTRPLPPRQNVAAPGNAAPVALRAPKARPDPTALRIGVGFTGVAAASALVTAFLTPGTALPAQPPLVQTVAVPPQRVPHVTRYVQLKPGQTAPPQAAVQPAAVPTPRIVTITTRQSGTRP
jgi:hypothetical protein